VRLRAGYVRRTFIGICDRSAVKPACISAETARATARACESPGQSPAWG